MRRCRPEVIHGRPEGGPAQDAPRWALKARTWASHLVRRRIWPGSRRRPRPGRSLHTRQRCRPSPESRAPHFSQVNLGLTRLWTGHGQLPCTALLNQRSKESTMLPPQVAQIWLSSSKSWSDSGRSWPCPKQSWSVLARVGPNLLETGPKLTELAQGSDLDGTLRFWPRCWSRSRSDTIRPIASGPRRPTPLQRPEREQRIVVQCRARCALLRAQIQPNKLRTGFGWPSQSTSSRQPLDLPSRDTPNAELPRAIPASYATVQQLSASRVSPQMRPRLRMPGLNIWPSAWPSLSTEKLTNIGKDF